MTQKDFTPPNGEGTARSGRGEQSGIVDEAKNIATHLASEAKHEVTHRASSQKDRAAQSLSTVADALRGTKHDLDEKVPAIGEYADKAADTVQQLSEYIRSKSVGEIIDTVEQFARRESALFLGGAFALGILGGRFLRSSRPSGGYGRDMGSRRELGGSYGRDRDYGRDYGRDDRDLGRSIGRESGMRAGGYGYGRDMTMGRRDYGGSTSGSIKDVGGSNISSNTNRPGTTGMSGGSMSGSSLSSASKSTGSMSGGSNLGSGSTVNRDTTKPGGFSAQPPRPGAGGTTQPMGAMNKPLTPSTSAPEYGPSKSGGAQSGPAGLSTSSTGQSSNLEEGSAGTGPATGSGVTPKKGSEVK